LDYDWRVEEYLATNRTTTCAETIVADGKRYVTRITQRWWSLEEMKDLARDTNLTLTKTNIAANLEHYLVLTAANGK
jgi:hypothetical protein